MDKKKQIFPNTPSTWIIPSLGFLLAFGLSRWSSSLFPSDIMLESDLWFGADIERVILNMTDPLSNYGRAYVHPLFPLLFIPITRPIYFVASIISDENITARIISAQIATSLSAGITWLLLYFISIGFGLKRFQSFAIGLLYLSSASFFFWWSVPESYPLGSPTIYLPFLLLSSRIKSQKIWLLALIASISVTVSNFSAGLIGTFIRFGYRKLFFKLSILAIVATSILFLIQKSYFPSAGSDSNKLSRELKFVNIFNPAQQIIYQFFVAPTIPLSPPTLTKKCPTCNVDRLKKGQIDSKGNQRLQLHYSIPKINEVSILGALAGITWVFLLLNGLFAILKCPGNKVSIALLGFVAFELLLHSFYGDSPFLYSAHYNPALILIAGFGLKRRNSESFRSSLTLLIIILSSFMMVYNASLLAKAFEIGNLYLNRYK